MAQFRFQNLEIWKRVIGIADQLRGAALSISNNIAEGAVSASIFNKRGLIAQERCETQLNELEEESKMIEAFRKSLLGGER
jgi:hypothetical protein